jgi:ABC-type dipeptide/oligopeptide/nickel transport system permease subunit
MAADETKSRPAAEEKKLAYYEAGQWTLVRRRFARHKVAVWMFWVILLLYLVCIHCEFFAPYDPNAVHKDFVSMPPQKVHFGPGPYVNAPIKRIDPVTLRREYSEDVLQPMPIRFFVRGTPWHFLGLFETRLHLFGVDSEAVLGVTGQGQTPTSVVIDAAPGAAGRQYTHVRLRDDAARLADVRPGDVLLVTGPDGEMQELPIAAVNPEDGWCRLKKSAAAAIPTATAAEIRRPRQAFLLGTDAIGQDVLSRILYGGRISLSIGFIGVTISFVLGVILGGLSGYFGGRIDMFIQRFAELLQSVPSIPIWLAMAAAIPKEWTSLQVYFIMTLILACMSWTGLCRVVRGKLLALREEDYARAALLAGATERRVIFVHLVPNFASHLIAHITLAIPGMILAETSLSFLGLGLRPPVVSWGVLLQQANTPAVVINQPWLLLPAVMVITAVLAFNFVGEGLRDAADPYAT